MSTCDYCGRTNREGAAFCDECGATPGRRRTPPPRQLTDRERKQGWLAVAVAVICGAAAAVMNWSESGTLRSFSGYVATFGATWAINTLWQFRKMPPGAGDDSKRQT